MSDPSQRCTTCGTDLPPGASRCPGCGRVFGEGNRCPHCHAVAGVQPSQGGYRCFACGKPRQIFPDTVVMGGGGPPLGALFGLPGAAEGGDAAAQEASAEAARAPAPRAASPQRHGAASRAKAKGLRALGAVMIGGTILLVAGVVGIFGGDGALVAAALGLTGGGFGYLSLRSAARAGEEAARQERRARELSILELAEAKGGVLTVTDVVRALRLSADEADAALSAMVDGTRVEVEVTSDGLLEYVFREVRSLSDGPRVRVAEDPLEEQFAELEERMEADASRQREGS